MFLGARGAVKRNIIKIDESKCDGCGQCVGSCAEGAIQIIQGKARLISETYCDGLGACLGKCPQDAIAIEEREARQFDEARASTSSGGPPEAGSVCAEDWGKNGSMEQFLNKGIKELIDQHPAVGDILREYDIGCVPCTIGTCLVKDVVRIHNLSPQDEARLMVRIARAVGAPEEAAAAYVPQERPEPRAVKANRSPVIQKLMDEHSLIKRLVALIPAAVDRVDVESAQGRKRIFDAADFIRSYADKYHHAKEEEILFKYFDADLEILKVMRAEHESARSHVRAMCEAADAADRQGVVEHLMAYRELLGEHIKKEDEILYPWLERQLSLRQIGELFSAFSDVDERFAGAPGRYEAFVNGLEAELADAAAITPSASAVGNPNN